MTTTRILTIGAAILTTALLIPALMRLWSSPAMAMALDSLSFCF